MCWSADKKVAEAHRNRILYSFRSHGSVSTNFRARQSIGKRRNKSRMKTSKCGIPIIILLKREQEKMQALHQKHILFPLLLPTFRMISSFGSNLQNPYIQKMFPKLNYKSINQIESCLQSGILDNFCQIFFPFISKPLFSVLVIKIRWDVDRIISTKI